MRIVTTLLLAALLSASCGPRTARTQESAAAASARQSAPAERYTYVVRNVYPPLTTSYTQGLQFADCELWGPISYDLIISKEACRLKNYECPWSGGGFDGIIAQDLIAGNILVKSWLIHAHAVTCGAVVGARIPIALTSRSANEEETYLSLVFCAVLDAWRKKNAHQ